MTSPNSDARLIIICGLPGGGKTTLARQLEARLGAVRFSADDWMAALAIDLYDEESRARGEARRWVLAQGLLQKLTVQPARNVPPDAAANLTAACSAL